MNRSFVLLDDILRVLNGTVRKNSLLLRCSASSGWIVIAPCGVVFVGACAVGACWRNGSVEVLLIIKEGLCGNGIEKLKGRADLYGVGL